MKIGIVIPTYQRKDNLTPTLLSRALHSIQNQEYSDYLVVLVGDHYVNHSELLELSTIIDPSKIIVRNLERAVEREKYVGEKLWCSGGVNATNIGIDICLENGVTKICHLDHDDWWEPAHLFKIYEAFLNSNYVIVATQSTFKGAKILPSKAYLEFYPTSSDLIHSAVCIDFSKTSIRYRDVFAEEGYPYAADGDLWNRLSKIMKKDNLKGYLIHQVTCHHSEEGYSKNEKIINYEN